MNRTQRRIHGAFSRSAALPPEAPCQLCGHRKDTHRYSCRMAGYKNTQCSCPGFVKTAYRCECGNFLLPGDKRMSDLCSECRAYEYANEVAEDDDE
jgi:hypothetical protein